MLTISRPRLLTGAAALALTASLGATPGHAATETANMGVNAQINQACTVASDGDLNFGPITPGVEAQTSTTFTVNCSFAGDVTIEVGPGGNHDGNKRQMESAENNLLGYQLWQDGLSAQWNGPETGVPVNAGDTIFDVIGIIPVSMSDGKPVGDYSDTVAISVTF